MTQAVETTRWMGNTPRADGHRKVLVLPGAQYPVEMPGLHFPMRALALQGWDVWRAAWDLADAGSDPQALVDDALGQFEAAAGEPPQLLLAKSLGTLAASWVADRAVPAIWTTPLLFDPDCVRHIARSTAPALLIAGSRDHAWDAEAASSTRKTVHVIPDADHGWQVGSWRTELDVLRDLTQAVEDFAGGLPL